MAAATDRHLLFGLIALQVGLIDQAQLVAAFQAWARDKARSLAEHLADRGGPDTEGRVVVEAMVALHIKAHGGDVAQSLAAIPAARSTRAGLAHIAIPEFDTSLASVGPGTNDDGDADYDRTASYAVGAATSDGQRFRILRPHAKGGLGAVFVALDGELHREVALKQILEAFADDPVSRARFLLEAEVTGGLEHPGIVPVYGLGTYGDGRPYYAMRFIRGDSLKDAIAAFHSDSTHKGDPGRRSLDLRKLLRRFLDVCNAIEYAHQRGVLHRDLKPANVMVGKYGETLVVDWGLAKTVGRSDPGASVGERALVPSSASGSAETLPGSAIGTPAYMSPEQAAGDLGRLGRCSDVYSLGAILYCLLTGKPPFEGDDLGAVLRAVQKGDFPAPRSVDASIDPALEAVCKKAMATAPEGRYATPRALADDVERWTADEPVAARPEPFSERARRWMRRRRTAMTASAAALVMATVGLASVLAVQSRANGALRRANDLLTRSVERETKANTQVQARFDLALEAIKTFHAGVSEDVLLTNDNLKPVRDRLLKDAGAFYKRLGDQLSGQSDRGSRRALGQAYTEMAGLAGKIGATDQAIVGHRQALAVRRGLAEAADADGDATAEVGRSLNDLGLLLKEFGRTDEARTAFEEARVLLADLTRANPSVTSFQLDLAASHGNIGNLLINAGKPGEALVSYEAARTIQQRLADANPAVTKFQRDLAVTYHNIGNLLRETGKPEEALASYQEARTIQQRLADANPAVTQFQCDLANSETNVGSLLKEAGKPAEALASYRAGLAIRQRLADANPAVTQFQRDVAGSHGNIGIYLKETGAPKEALAALKVSRMIAQRLANANPAVTDFQIWLANAQLETSDVLRLTGETADARASYEAALAIIDRLIKAQPAFADPLQVYLVFGLKGLGATQQTAGQTADAVVSWRRAIATDKPTHSSKGETLYSLAGCHCRLGAIAGATGSGVSAAEGVSELDRAMGVLRGAIVAGYHPVTWMKRDPDLDPLRARSDFQALMADLVFPSEPFAESR